MEIKKVVVIGSAPNHPYNYLHLGNSTKTLQELADGTHPYSERLKAADIPMIMVSSLTLERRDGEGILNAINKLQEGTNLLSTEDQWNGFNVLHNESAKINALELGITTKHSSEVPTPKVVYLSLIHI